MSVGRKESNNLVEKAGKAIVDLALSLSSRHAISNAACSEGMRLRNVTYYNGKLYQLNLDGTRGDEVKMGGTPLLDFANPLYTFDTTHTSYTTAKECYLFVGTIGAAGAAGVITLTVDGTPIITGHNNSAGVFYEQVFTGYLKLSAGVPVILTGNITGENIYILDLK